MEREFRKRKRDMSFRRRGDGLSVLLAMNIDNGLRLVFELLERVDTPHLPPEAMYEALFLKVPWFHVPCSIGLIINCFYVYYDSVIV